MNQQPPSPWLDQLREIELVDGEADSRMQVLLWLARAVFDQEDLDSYETVFPTALHLGGGGEGASAGAWVDGIAHQYLGDAVVHVVHVVFVWVRDGASRDPDLSNALEVGGLVKRNSDTLESKIQESDASSELHSELRRVRREADTYSWKVVAVTPTSWGASEDEIANLGIDAWDAARMSRIAAAQRDPSLLRKTLTITATESERLQTFAGNRRVFVAPVRGVEIADWPGIEDRRLFDLNVRFSLGGSTRVRQSLDEAFGREGQGDFLALHNGLTVICHAVKESPTELKIEDVSVVNGAQSVIALADNRGKISDDLRVLVKFVEIGDDDELAREIAVRSNTQNPVSGRNLRALDESQIEMKKNLSRRGYVLDTRPDASRVPVPRTIKNDDAAQWICAVYLERPWLAVKRTSLFAPGIFQEIFSGERTPEQVILLNSLRGVLDAKQEVFTAGMRRAWLLTRLTAMYLCGQIMRFDADYQELLLTPSAPDGDSLGTLSSLETLAIFVAEYLCSRQEVQIRSNESDDFRVEFKRQRTLLEMSAEVSKAWRLAKRDGSA